MSKPCPVCKSMIIRRNGACPICGAKLRLYHGNYEVDTGKPPAVEILDRFLELKPHIQLTHQERIRELRLCRLYYERCGKDIEVALKSVELQLTDPKFSWANRSGIGGLFFDLPDARGQARRIIDRQRASVAQQSDTAATIQSRENVFA